VYYGDKRIYKGAVGCFTEMGSLREFGNAHGDAVRKALEPEIVSLHTLYNYLIA
jgi:hypothetical protein